MPGLTVTDPVRALGAAHPDLNVEVLRTDWTNQVAVLHDGRADIGYVSPEGVGFCQDVSDQGFCWFSASV